MLNAGGMPNVRTSSTSQQLICDWFLCGACNRQTTMQRDEENRQPHERSDAFASISIRR